MNKLFSKIAALSVGLAMAVGVGVAVGSSSRSVEHAKADSVDYQLIPNQENTGSSSASYITSAYTFTYESVSWTMNQWNPKTLQVKTNQSSASGEFNFFTGEFPGNITSVVLTFSTLNVSNANGFFLVPSTSAHTSLPTSGGEAMTWNSTNKTLSWSGSASSGFKAIAFYQNGKVASSSNFITSIDVTYDGGSSGSTMVVKNSSGEQSPFQLTYGSLGGMLFYGYEEDGSTKITSGITWTVSDSDVLVLDDDFADNHCWVKPGTKIGEATLTASKEGYSNVVSTITVVPGAVEEIEVSGSMTNTSYKVNDDWDPTGLLVNAIYDSGYNADVTSQAEWSFNPAKATSTSVNSVVATASYGGQSADSDPQSVTVVDGATYDLSKIDGFSDWTNSYTEHSVSSADIDSELPGATMSFSITNKQSSGVGSEYPCIGARTNSELQCLVFTLTAENKKISTIEIVFVTRYTSTYPSLYLHKGSGISGEQIAELTMSGSAGNELKLIYNGGLNDTVFTVGYNAHQAGSNGAVGIKSISVGLSEQGTYGETDHIKVVQFPNTVYHVGEVFDSTGLQVFAYDGASEATANFKDVTSEVEMGFTSGVYTFSDSDVPTANMWLSYEEGGQHFYAEDIVFHVYALAQYELVTNNLEDWSGNYLIVDTNGESELCAMNGGLDNPDVEKGYKVVSDVDGIIEAGQELEWTVASYSDGYSIQGKSGKYIGSLTAKSNGMLVSDERVKNTISVSEGDATITGTNTYNLELNTTGDRFRYYASGTVKLYRLKTSDKADEYAQTFLGAIACDASGESEPDFNIKEGEIKWSWSLLAAEYNELNPAEKEQFRLGVASKTGSNIEQALARYDYIIGKYGDTKYANFMLREHIPPIPSNNFNVAEFNSSNNMMIIIVVISSVTVLSLGVLIALKKKKHN